MNHDLCINVYTDGSCMKSDPKDSTGVGGWAFVILGEDSWESFAVSGGEQNSTNNRMELMAVIEALKFVLSQRATIHTDSDYVRRCAMGEWKRKANLDLWRLYDKASAGRQIMWVKVKAHSGDYWNDYVDSLAGKESSLGDR